MDFKFCLLAQIALISYARIPSRDRDRDDVIAVSIYSNEQEEGGSPAAILVSLRNFKPLLLGSQCIF